MSIRSMADLQNAIQSLTAQGWNLTHQKHHREAFAIFRKAVDLAPDQLGPQFGLAHSLFELGKFEASISSFKRCLEIDGFHQESYMKLASCYYLQNQLDQALQIWIQGRAAQQHVAHHYGQDITRRYFSSFWTVNVGHMGHLETPLKCMLLGLTPIRKYSFLMPEKVANRAYLAQWAPWIEIVAEPQEIQRRQAHAQLVQDHMDILWVGDRWMNWDEACYRVETAWKAAGRGPLLEMTPAQIDQGRALLGEIGLPRDAWFVTLHVREEGFHTYDMHRPSYRNGEIATYQEAIRRITDAGGWVVRLGGPTMTPLPLMDRVIDYAHHPARQEWLDIFLSAQARFLIGTNSGMGLIAHSYGVPCLQTNWAPLARQGALFKTVLLPKLLWSERKNRHLTFREQLTHPLGTAELRSQLEELHLRPRANTPEELAEGVDEMLRRTAAGWLADVEDDALQRRYSDLMQEFSVFTLSRIGEGFLRRHSNLL